MLTAREVRLAHDVAAELRERGADEKAAAVEHAVARATAPPSPETGGEAPAFFTVSQAARALSVSVSVLKKWVAAGDLQTIHRGGHVVITRDALGSFLEHLRQRQPMAAERPVVSERAAARRAFVLAGLAPHKIDRVRSLTDKLESSESLTSAEELELENLQDEFARVSWTRLKQWVEQQPSRT